MTTYTQDQKEKLFDQWITDLRSGEFEQGEHTLYCGYEAYNGQHQVLYCCLGVLAKRLDWNMGGYNEFAEIPTREWPFNREIEVRTGANLVQYILTDLNDSKRWSFEAIADWLEEKREELLYE